MRSFDATGTASPWSIASTFTIDTPAALSSLPTQQNTSRPTVSWAALPGAVKYDLWLNNLSTGQSQVVRNQNLNGTSWIPSTDLPLGKCRVWVRGIDAGGTAAQWSSPTDFHVVPAPTLTSPRYATFNRRPTFVWTPVTGATKYEVFVRNLNSGVTTYNVKNIATTSWTPPANLADGPYRWWVQATSASNVTSLWSAPTDVYVGGRTTITGPVGSTGDATPTFTWRPVQGAVRYELWVSNAITLARVIYQTGLTGTSYTPTANLAKGLYRVWVRAVSASGENAVWSAELTFSVVSSGEFRSGIDQSLLASFTRKSPGPMPKLAITESYFEQTYEESEVASEGTRSERSETWIDRLMERYEIDV